MQQPRPKAYANKRLIASWAERGHWRVYKINNLVLPETSTNWVNSRPRNNKHDSMRNMANGSWVSNIHFRQRNSSIRAWVRRCKQQAYHRRQPKQEHKRERKHPAVPARPLVRVLVPTLAMALVNRRLPSRIMRAGRCWAL